MDSSSEHRENQPQKLEIVKLGEEFQLFNPNRTEVTDEGVSDKGLSNRTIGLKAGELPTLNFVFRLRPHYGVEPIASRFYPFDPEKGYKVTNEDYDPRKRAIKASRIFRDYVKEEYATPKKTYGQRYLDFWASLYVSDPSLRLYPNDKERFNFKPEIQKKIEKLRLHLFFPNLSFEGKPDPEYMKKGIPLFDIFYPLDSPPLPTSPSLREEWYSSPHEGLSVSFPMNNPEYSQSVNGMFVMDARAEENV